MTITSCLERKHGLAEDPPSPLGQWGCHGLLSAMALRDVTAGLRLMVPWPCQLPSMPRLQGVPFSFFISSYSETNTFTRLSKPLAFKSTDKVMQYCRFCYAVQILPCLQRKFKGRSASTRSSRVWILCDPFAHVCTHMAAP